MLLLFLPTGPTVVRRDQSRPLSVSTYEYFRLEIAGTGLSTADRIRVVAAGVACGSAGSSAHTAELRGALAQPSPATHAILLKLKSGTASFSLVHYHGPIDWDFSNLKAGETVDLLCRV